MNRNDLIKEVAVMTGLSQKDVGMCIGFALERLTDSLKNGEKVKLAGFGSFSVKKRKARTGRNPKTGEKIEIPARNAVKFAPSSDLKKAVN